MVTLSKDGMYIDEKNISIAITSKGIKAEIKR